MSEAYAWPDIKTAIGGVPSASIGVIWPYVLPLLKRVVGPRTGFSLESIHDALSQGRMQLWVIGDMQAAVITLIQERFTEKVLWVQFVSGARMADWLDDWIAVMEAFARAKGCVAIEFAGRDGWRKWWKTHRDWQPISTTYRKDL